MAPGTARPLVVGCKEQNQAARTLTGSTTARARTVRHAGRVAPHPFLCRFLPSPLNGRGGELVEEFGSVTRRFPWSVIAIEALSPMVFIHTCWIIIVPGHQHLLGFLAPLFESHRRLVWVMDRPLGDRSPELLFRIRQVAAF